MKRIIKVLIVSFLAIFLVACDKSSSNDPEAGKAIQIAFDQLSIEKQIDHSLLLPKTLKVNNYIVNLTYESSDESIMTNQGIVTRAFDDQVVTLNIVAKANKVIRRSLKEILVLGTRMDFKPVNDVEQEKILKELEEKENEVLTRIKNNNSCKITNTISVIVNNESATQTNEMNLIYEPFYMETQDKHGNLNIYKEEEGKIIEYIEYANYISRTLFAKNKDEIMDSLYNEYLDNDILDFFQCEKKNEEYIFKTTFEEILDTDFGKQMANALNSIKFNEEFSELPIYVRIQIKEDKIINICSLNFKINGVGYACCKSEMIYQMADVKEHTFPSDKKIWLPKSIDSVTSYSELGEEIKVYKKECGYFRYNLKQGTYCLDSDENFSNQGAYNYYNYKIYDQNGEQLNLNLNIGLGKTDYGLLGMNYVFTIPSDGTYYIKIENFEQNDILFIVKKLDYESGCSMDKAKDVVSSTGTINGLYDFHIFKTNTTGFYTLTNIGDKSMFIAIPTIRDTFEYIEVLPNEDAFIYLNKYRSYFFVCPNKIEESYTYNFEIENREEELKYASSKDLQKMSNLETNKSYVFSNAIYNIKYFKIKIENKGEYKFDTLTSDYYIQIKTIDNEYINRASIYKLDVGEYIVEIGYSGDNIKYSIDQTTIAFKQIS